MPWRIGDEVWSVYCDNVPGVGLTYVPGLVGQVMRIDRETLIVRRHKPGPIGELTDRVLATGRAWNTREPCADWCASKVGPYGPGRGRGAMGVGGSGSAHRD